MSAAACCSWLIVRLSLNFRVLVHYIFSSAHHDPAQQFLTPRFVSIFAYINGWFFAVLFPGSDYSLLTLQTLTLINLWICYTFFWYFQVPECWVWDPHFPLAGTSTSLWGFKFFLYTCFSLLEEPSLFILPVIEFSSHYFQIMSAYCSITQSLSAVHSRPAGIFRLFFPIAILGLLL